MTSIEFNVILARLGLRPPGAALFLGIATRSAQAYSAGKRPIPEPCARLMQAAERDPTLLRVFLGPYETVDKIVKFPETLAQVGCRQT